MTHDVDHAPSDRGPEQVAHLFDIAGREDEALRQLDGCVAQLHQVQAAKAALKQLTPAEVRAALEFRHATLGQRDGRP